MQKTDTHFYDFKYIYATTRFLKEPTLITAIPIKTRRE